jgi:4-amino-4-deoxy-L-arabinose transferase-like glycosyltransferase
MRVRRGFAGPSLALVVCLSGCVALALLCRLPFLQVPLTNDEGGYAYVARLWAGGAQLYGHAWVDRPQGLMLLFRLFVSVAPTTLGLRLCAALYAALNVLLIAVVGSQLYGRRAGLCAAALYAVFSSGPQIEGFIVNGELLATLPTLLAVALLLRARAGTRAGWLLYAAGVAAGCALLVKQSAIDGPALVMLGAIVGGWKERRSRWSRLMVAGLGIATPLALSAAHGLATNWTEYLDAVLLDSLRYRAFDSAPGPLASGLAVAGSYLGEEAFLLVGVLASIAAMLARRTLCWLPLVWLGTATVGIMLGGLFSRHYFVQLLPPLCLMAADGLLALVCLARQKPVAGALLGLPLAALLLAAWTDGPYYVGLSPIMISQRLYGWGVYTHQGELVRMIESRVPRGAPFFVAYAAAPLHYLSGRPSITRYIWRRPLGTVPGAYQAALSAVERAEPVCIVTVQPVAQLPGDRRMGAALARYYSLTWTRPGVSLYCRSRQA